MTAIIVMHNGQRYYVDEYDVYHTEKIVDDLTKAREEKRFIEVSEILDMDGRKRREVWVNPDFIAEVRELQ